MKFLRSSKGLYVATAILASPANFQSVLAASQNSHEVQWLFSHQVQLYAYLLGNPEIPRGTRDNVSAGVHKLAFEYLLLCRLAKAQPSLWWRSHLRELLHKSGSNAKAFADPAGIMPHFRQGQLAHTIAISAVAGIDPHIWTEKEYTALVHRFQLSYPNLTNLFPVLDVPLFALNESDNLPKFVGRRWPLVSFDGLPTKLQNDPFSAYELLAPRLRVYYLPAFLRMCERYQDEVRDLPRHLMRSLSSEAGSDKNTRDLLTSEQRHYLLAFFSDLFGDDSSMHGQLEALRTSLGVSLDENLKLRD
jgi:hypothetical protein